MSSKNSSLEMLKLGFVLAIFAAASCTVLALVNSVTSVKIAANKIAKANAAMKVVMADADSFEAVESFAPSQNASIKIQSLRCKKRRNYSRSRCTDKRTDLRQRHCNGRHENRRHNYRRSVS